MSVVGRGTSCRNHLVCEGHTHRTGSSVLVLESVGAGISVLPRWVIAGTRVFGAVCNRGAKAADQGGLLPPVLI